MQGISAQDIKKLKDGGFATIKAVLTASRKQLTSLKVFSFYAQFFHCPANISIGDFIDYLL
jgi:hypothetical protein